MARTPERRAAPITGLKDGLVGFPAVRRPLALLVIAALALTGAGCGSSPAPGVGQADLANGKKLFTTTCGGCHTLGDAGTKGTIGPNLDTAYAQPASQGWERSSFEALVKNQIDWGSPDAQPPMPAHLLKGQDATDVAAYVAAVAANGSSSK